MSSRKKISAHDKPFTEAKLVRPTIVDDKIGMVVLDKIEPGVEPPYCTHGKTNCYVCDDWCWLGSETHEAVANGGVVGICMPCARKTLPKDARPSHRLKDHR